MEEEEAVVEGLPKEEEVVEEPRVEAQVVEGPREEEPVVEGPREEEQVTEGHREEEQVIEGPRKEEQVVEGHGEEEEAVEGLRKVVVTGFGPFDCYKINPSWEVAKELDNLGLNSMGIELILQQIPVSYDCVLREIPLIWEECNPTLVVHMGVHGNICELQLESMAYRKGYCKGDIDGECPRNGNCNGTEDSITSELDLQAVCEKIRDMPQIRIRPKVSTDAGRYVCEFTYFMSLNINNARVVFIHVPEIDKPYSVKEMAECVKEIILLLVDQVEENAAIPPENQVAEQVESIAEETVDEDMQNLQLLRENLFNMQIAYEDNLRKMINIKGSGRGGLVTDISKLEAAAAGCRQSEVRDGCEKAVQTTVCNPEAPTYNKGSVPTITTYRDSGTEEVASNAANAGSMRESVEAETLKSATASAEDQIHSRGQSQRSSGEESSRPRESVVSAADEERSQRRSTAGENEDMSKRGSDAGKSGRGSAAEGSEKGSIAKVTKSPRDSNASGREASVVGNQSTISTRQRPSSGSRGSVKFPNVAAKVDSWRNRPSVDHRPSSGSRGSERAPSVTSSKVDSDRKPSQGQEPTSGSRGSERFSNVAAKVDSWRHRPSLDHRPSSGSRGSERTPSATSSKVDPEKKVSQGQRPTSGSRGSVKPPSAVVSKVDSGLTKKKFSAQPVTNAASVLDKAFGGSKNQSFSSRTGSKDIKTESTAGKSPSKSDATDAANNVGRQSVQSKGSRKESEASKAESSKENRQE